MNCSNVKTELACWTDSTGKATTIKIVTEFSYDAAGELIVYKTRYVNAADEVIEIPSSDTVTLGECCVACAPERFDGCAAGVPYKQLIYINGSGVTNKYINLETGAVSVTPPEGFALGSCSEVPADTQMCYQNGTDVYSKVIVSGVAEYYKNGTLLTEAVDIAIAVAVVENATSADLVPCYTAEYTAEVTEGTKIGTFTNERGEVVDVFIPAAKQFAQVVYVNDINPNTATIFDLENPPATNDDTLKLLDDAIYIGVNGSVWTSDGSVYRTYVAPSGTEFVLTGTSTDAFDSKTAYIERFGSISINGESRGLVVDADNYHRTGFMKFQGDSMGLVQQKGAMYGQNLFIGRWEGTDIQTPTTLYRDLVVDEASGYVGIDDATPTFRLDVNGTSRFVDTPTITTATMFLVKDPATGQTSEQLIPTSGSGGTPATDEEIATAGQTAFTLSGEPLAGVVWAFRNGVRLPNAAVTVSGSDATYVPAANNGDALLAGDRITFDYTK